MSQDTLNLCGVTLWSPKRWAKLGRGTPAGQIRAAVDELVATRFVVIDDDCEELWIRTFLKHDRVLSVPNIVKAMTQDFETVRSQPIRAGIIQSVQALHPGGFVNYLIGRFPTAFPRDLHRLGRQFLKELGEPLPEG